MEGRSKSRFPEKCKNCIWGRFPSQFWPHFGAMLAPKMHFFSKKQLLEINQKKRYPPSLKQPRGRTTAKPDGSRKAPPRARAFSNKKQLFEQLLGIVLDLLRKKRSRCNKSEMVAEKFKSSVQLVRVLPKVNQNLLKKVFGLLEQMLLLWIHEVVEEVAASSWKKTQCRWSDTPWAKARRILWCWCINEFAIVFPARIESVGVRPVVQCFFVANSFRDVSLQRG